MQTFFGLGVSDYVGWWDAIGVRFLHKFLQFTTFLDTNWVEKVGAWSRRVELTRLARGILDFLVVPCS